MAHRERMKNQKILLQLDSNQSSGFALQQYTWRAVLAGLFEVGFLLAYLRIVPLMRVRQLTAGIVKPPSLRRGFLGFLNYLIGWWNLKYQDGRPMFQLKDLNRQDLILFGVLLGLLLLSVVWYLLRRKRILLLEILALGIMVPGVVLGRFSPAGFACTISAGVGIWIYQLHSQANGRRAIWMVGLGTVLLTLAFLCSDAELPAVSRLRQAASDQIQIIRFGEDSLPQGKLRKAGSMHDGDTVRLKVTSQQVKDLYLRGFVGADYAVGTWKPLTRAAYGGGNNGMLKWLGSQGFFPAAQYASYEKLGVSQLQPNSLKIENLGARRNYLYLPYSVSELQASDKVTNQDNGYCSKKLFGSRAYNAAEISDALPAELLHQENWLSVPETSGQKQYIDQESVYRSFVYQFYRNTDSRLEPLIRENILEGSVLPEGIYTAASEIRKGLETRMAYEEHPTKVSAAASEREDPLYEFLSGQRSGNDALFASAAVQAFRVCGIPARYVEGYLLRSQAARDADQGTVTLTNRDSHAWCEVYMDGVGWVPVDTTPGYYYDTYKLIQLLEFPQGIQQTSAEENSEEQADQILQEEETKASGEEDGKAEQQLLAILAGIWCILLLILAVAVVLMEMIRWFREQAYRRSYRLADASDRVKLQCDTILSLLAALGIEAHPGWKNQETENLLRKRMPVFAAGEYLRVSQVMERYLYGKQKLEPYEERVLTGFADRLIQKADGLSRREQLRLRWFRLLPANQL